MGAATMRPLAVRWRWLRARGVMRVVGRMILRAVGTVALVVVGAMIMVPVLGIVGLVIADPQGVLALLRLLLAGA